MADPSRNRSSDYVAQGVQDLHKEFPYPAHGVVGSVAPVLLANTVEALQRHLGRELAPATASTLRKGSHWLVTMQRWSSELANWRLRPGRLRRITSTKKSGAITVEQSAGGSRPGAARAA
jgi:hypothetical protein